MPSPKKKRVPIPEATAAEVLFLADRTCCVCRQRGKPVQIHHIDDDPSNNDLLNLSVLCLECHRETQIRGGFDRKLDAEQVRLYRENWNRVVADVRATSGTVTDQDRALGAELELATSLAEIYRERAEWVDLARHYDSVNNAELRDKYVELAIEKGVSPATEAWLRATLQKRADLVSRELADQALDTPDWTARARLLRDLGRTREAVAEYLRGIEPFPVGA